MVVLIISFSCALNIWATLQFICSADHEKGSIGGLVTIMLLSWVMMNFAAIAYYWSQV